MASGNTLYFGNNLDVLKLHVKDETVDLVYLDPPFNSNQEYNVLFDEADGTPAAAQVRAFGDTWKWDMAAAADYELVVEKGGPVADALIAFRGLLKQSNMMAYLSRMAPRLVELKRVLKSEGTIYLHCDPVASHYLKVLMDAVFGAKNCRREVIWRSGWVSGFKAGARNWIRNHDVLLYYVKDRNNFTFNKELAYRPHPPDYKRRGGGGNPKGVAIDDVWDEVALYSPWIKSFSKEKLGYMTQKPIELLKRIISVCSRPGDLVLDPFCGCGTTIAAAEALGRRWIGIDITFMAIGVIRRRLRDQFPDIDFRTVGEPTTIEDARALADEDKFQFQVWALDRANARPPDTKRGADKGIDGQLYFHDEAAGGKTKQVIFSVKGGHVGVSDVRDLIGVLDREKAQIGVVISLNEPTRAMRQEAASAGFYTSPWDNKKYPRVQLLTVGELLEGKTVQLPPTRANVTFKGARRPNEIAENLPLYD